MNKNEISNSYALFLTRIPLNKQVKHIDYTPRSTASWHKHNCVGGDDSSSDLKRLPIVKHERAHLYNPPTRYSEWNLGLMCHRASSLHIHVSPWYLEGNKKQRTIYWRVEGGREERDILNSVKSAPWREPILESQSHCCSNAHHNCLLHPHRSRNTSFLLDYRSTYYSPQKFFTIEIQIEALQLTHLGKGKVTEKT